MQPVGIKESFMATEFTPFMSLFGGILIGVAAIALMALHGRIAGMTGILAGVLPPVGSDWQWRAAFLAGAIIAPALYLIAGGSVPFAVPVPVWAMVLGGVIVGIGVHFGSGCTSGHGVCGMARLSPRSIVATITFMITTGITVYVMRHVLSVGVA
ncbi:MAG: YeeE/YedE family protein [Phyllobacteriaceae bacterium]|nr:YeeE/YedE family protein [Phyllobacteriaceae bacterium]